MVRRRILTNTTGQLMLVLVEPYALDYWLRPGESVELRAEVDAPDEDFELEDGDEGIVVTPSSGMGFVEVYAGDVALPRGHQRPEGRGEPPPGY